MWCSISSFFIRTTCVFIHYEIKYEITEKYGKNLTLDKNGTKIIIIFITLDCAFCVSFYCANSAKCGVQKVHREAS
jgi:hypothetical protein